MYGDEVNSYVPLPPPVMGNVIKPLHTVHGADPELVLYFPSTHAVHCPSDNVYPALHVSVMVQLTVPLGADGAHVLTGQGSQSPYDDGAWFPALQVQF